MVLFTKEVFLQLKTLTVLHINGSHNFTHNQNGEPIRTEIWQIYIQGTVDSSQQGDCFQTYINAASKEDAYRIYKELSQQVIDSGEVPTLNDKLIESVLKQ